MVRLWRERRSCSGCRTETCTNNELNDFFARTVGSNLKSCAPKEPKILLGNRYGEQKVQKKIGIFGSE